MQDWQDWLAAHQPTLRSIGLPVDVYLSHEHWLDFLENGHLHWHPEENAGFDFKHLNDAQQKHLFRFLDSKKCNDPIRSYLQARVTRDASDSFPLLDFLRHRVGPRE